MNKKTIILNTTLVLGLSSFVLPSIQAEASPNIHSVQEQRSTIQANLSKAEQELAAVLTEQTQLNEQIGRINGALLDNQAIIAKTETDIVSTQEEVAKLEAEMAVIEERIAKRTEVLKQRAQALQVSGGTVSYLEVLIGANSIGNLIDRVGAVSKIVEADQELLEQHDADKSELQDKKTVVDTKLAELNSMKTEYEGMQAQIEAQRNQNDALKQQLELKQSEIAAKKTELQAKDSNLAAIEAQVQSNLEQAKQQVQANVNNSQSTATTSNTTGATKATAPSATANVSATAAAPAVKASGNINTVINAGYKYIGNSSYKFGGGRTASDIANGLFDCSGFVHWAFAQAGISVGSSTDSLKNSGTRVSTSDMQPGDLVFFDTYKKDGHVGIYLGGGKFIGSQDSTGIAIANMNSGYWADHFNGRVVRI